MLSVSALEFCAAASPAAQQWHHGKVGMAHPANSAGPTLSMGHQDPESSVFPRRGVILSVLGIRLMWGLPLSEHSKEMRLQTPGAERRGRMGRKLVRKTRSRKPLCSQRPWKTHLSPSHPLEAHQRSLSFFRGYRPKSLASPYRALPGLAPVCLSRLIALCARMNEDAMGIWRPQRVIAGGRGRPGEGHKGPCKWNSIILISEPGKLRFGQIEQLTLSYAPKEWSGQALNTAVRLQSNALDVRLL